jgi:hypothetical protein
MDSITSKQEHTDKSIRLIAAKQHSRITLLSAAKVARTRHQLNRAPVSELFFEVLDELGREGTTQ